MSGTRIPASRSLAGLSMSVAELVGGNDAPQQDLGSTPTSNNASASKSANEAFIHSVPFGKRLHPQRALRQEAEGGEWVGPRHRAV